MRDSLYHIVSYDYVYKRETICIGEATMTHEATDSEQWYTIGDTALLVERSPQTVRGWVRSGRLPAIRTRGGVRLIKPSDALRVASEHGPHPEHESDRA
jgi:hypothetical protein